MSKKLPRIAVLVPCYNEEIAIGDTVRGFQAAMPHARIYVYDNNSKDRTMEVARQAGAIVRRETLQGKGNVVRRMFSDVDADVYVMTDGDATYDPAQRRGWSTFWSRRTWIWWWAGASRPKQKLTARGHVLGNRMLTGFLAQLFGQRFTDILSGYRVFSRRFAKSFPALSAGFETETELTVHALTLNLPIAEVETKYFARPEGSVSKLSTYRDGFRILRVMLALFKNERPITFFGLAAVSLALISIALSVPVGDHVPGNGARTALPDGHLIRNDHDARLPQRRLRARAGHGYARPERDEAARLSAGRSTPRSSGLGL